MHERVGEDSRHGIVYVDIQVGSCICFSVCLCWIIACALRWGVTHVGDFHYWHCSSCRGNIISGTGAIGKAALIRGRFEKKADM